jgi:hypothetical protein
LRRSSSKAFAVMAMIGTCPPASFPIARIFRVVSRPCALSLSDRPCECTKVRAVNVLDSLPKRNRHTSVRPRIELFSVRRTKPQNSDRKDDLRFPIFTAACFTVLVISFLGKQANQRHAHGGLGFCRMVRSRLRRCIHSELFSQI